MEIVSPSYFVQLPAECLELIIQLVYESNGIEVRGDICTDTTTRGLDKHGGLSLLFSQASPFRPVVSSMFTKIAFDRSPKYARHGRNDLVAPCCSTKYIEISPESDVGLDTGLMRQVFRICGPSIESISFGSMEFNDTTDGENEKTRAAHKFASLVLRHCAKVKGLSFHQKEKFGPNWIAEKLVFHKFAPQLDSLTLQSNFPTTMPRLGACSSLRELRYLGGCSEHLIQLLLTIGGTLERLSIERDNGDVDTDKFFEVTRKTCTRLHSFSVCNEILLGFVLQNVRYIPFLCSYGDQLIDANLNYLAPEELQKVVASCPSLDVAKSWSCLGLPESPECVSVLGPRLRSLQLFCIGEPASEWPEILAKCTDLRELTLHFDLGARRLPPFLRLEKFELDSVCASAPLIAHLASMAPNLRSVKFDISSDIRSGHIFQPLVESNKLLRDVSIGERVSGQQPRRRLHAPCSLQLLRELVETFAKCRKLDIHLFQTENDRISLSEVKNICGVLPCRDVEVRIEMSPVVFYEQTGKPGRLDWVYVSDTL